MTGKKMFIENVIYLLFAI